MVIREFIIVLQFFIALFSLGLMGFLLLRMVRRQEKKRRREHQSHSTDNGDQT